MGVNDDFPKGSHPLDESLTSLNYRYVGCRKGLQYDRKRPVPIDEGRSFLLTKSQLQTFICYSW